MQPSKQSCRRRDSLVLFALKFDQRDVVTRRLGMIADTAEESDLIDEIDGLTILMRPALYAQVGEVSIFCAEDPEKNEFILVSDKPLSEWEGFGSSNIRL